MNDFESFLAALLPEPHTVTVEAHEGSGGYGDTYGAPVAAAPCFVDHKRRNVRGVDGSVTISGTTVYAPPGTVCPPRSRVTLPDGTATVAIVTTVRDGAGADVPSHVEISCE